MNLACFYQGTCERDDFLDIHERENVSYMSMPVCLIPEGFKDQIAVHATDWMNLKSVMLRERSQSQNVTYYTVPYL